MQSYNGDADGYAYGSHDRLITKRKRGIVKPVGTNDIYRYPDTDSMSIGWWKDDPCIVNETWYKCAKRHPVPTAFNKALEINKYFMLYKRNKLQIGLQ